MSGVAESIRTCLACRKKSRQGELIRFVLQDVEVVVDVDRILSGRGAYCCKNSKCLRAFLKNRKSLLRAFRCQELRVADVEHFL